MHPHERVHTIIDEAEKLSTQLQTYKEHNEYIEQKLRQFDNEVRELKRETIFIIFWAVVLVCVCTVGGFLLGRRSMTVPDIQAVEQKEYPDTPLMEQHDSYDGELLRVISFKQFVDLYPRLVESHDKDFAQQALDGKKIEAISCYFIRKPE